MKNYILCITFIIILKAKLFVQTIQFDTQIK